MKRVSDAGRERVRLETWGELANHLGVEVRTAQRWEDKLGLPVRRLQGSQAVYGFVDEIDAWRAAREKFHNGAVEEPMPAVVPATGTDPEKRAASAGLHPWRAIALIAIAALIGAVVLLYQRQIVSAAEPSTFVVHNTQLIAISPEGTRVWAYDFKQAVQTVDTGFRQELRQWWERVDFDADGIDEIVAVVSHAESNGLFADVLHCFTLDGKLRFSVKPDLTLTFGAGKYTGPWVFWDVEAIPEDQSLWLAFEHSPWWPSGIMRIDRNGAATLKYVQPGSIKVLRTLREGGKLLLLAAGVNNEYQAASVAMLDTKAPPSAAPQSRDGPFKCLECPPGLPLMYVLLPQTPLGKADGWPYNRVDVLTINDGVRVQTYESLAAGVIYELRRDLMPISATPTDGYWSWRPRTGSTWRPDPRRRFENQIRRWTLARGWMTSTIGGVAPGPAGEG